MCVREIDECCQFAFGLDFGDLKHGASNFGGMQWLNYTENGGKMQEIKTDRPNIGRSVCV